MDIVKIQGEIDAKRRSVSFDSYDITIKQLYDMLLDGMIDIAPEYQRHFKWGAARQSALIESLILGIPVPSLFMATNPDSSWEVVDGLQRITTIVNFIGDKAAFEKLKIREKQLTLSNLDKLESMNGVSYHDLPKSLQFMLLTRPLRVTVLNDRSDFGVRYDLFERLNTGGITLHEHEIRNCIFKGEFNDFINELSEYSSFRSVLKMTESAERNRSYEELVLRFFAYLESREEFVHSVKGFLNLYMEKKTKSFRNRAQLNKVFRETFDALAAALPGGIVRGARKNVTPIVLYEAISVGSAVAISRGKKVKQKTLQALLDDAELKKLTTGATNTRSMVLERIELVSDRL